jgi:hypothetical protein
MLEQGFADKAGGVKLPIFPDPSPVIFTARSRAPFNPRIFFSRLVAHPTYL